LLFIGGPSRRLAPERGKLQTEIAMLRNVIFILLLISAFLLLFFIVDEVLYAGQLVDIEHREIRTLFVFLIIVFPVIVLLRNIIQIVFFKRLKFMIRHNIERVILVLPFILIIALILYLSWGLHQDYGI